MALDDALRKIGEDSPAASPAEGALSSKQGKLFAFAHKMLGDYLAERYFSGLEGTSIEGFLRTVAPFVLLMEPGNDPAIGKVNYLTLVESMDWPTWEHVLRLAGAGHLLGTDLTGKEGSERADLAAEADCYLPCWRAALETLFTLSPTGGGEPYLFVYGMAPEHRALATAAISIGMDKGDLHVWGGEGDIRHTLLISLPTLSHFAEAARRYGVTDVRDTLADLNRVADLYLTAWEEKTEEEDTGSSGPTIYTI